MGRGIGRGRDLPDRLAAFEAAIAAGNELDEMALAIGALLRPQLDLVGCLADLDELAAACPTPTRDGVVDFLMSSSGAGFRGDVRDYHAPANSCLDQVLLRRRGMPITLSVVTVEVARRVGVPLAGVGLPGHFLVGDPADPTWFADPFDGRSGLTLHDVRAIYHRLGGSRWSDSFVAPASPRQIVVRILNNLTMSLRRRGVGPMLSVVMAARATMPEFAAERDALPTTLAPLN